jgi:uncharacterized protein HemY
MKTNTASLFNIILIAVATIALTVATVSVTYGQNTTDVEQVKDYLNQAMQAIDIGNNTQALKLVEQASDQLENMTGIVTAGEESEEDEEDEEDEESEEDEEDEEGGGNEDTDE